jgi:hypothetical protein
MQLLMRLAGQSQTHSEAAQGATHAAQQQDSAHKLEMGIAELGNNFQHQQLQSHVQEEEEEVEYYQRNAHAALVCRCEDRRNGKQQPGSKQQSKMRFATCAGHGLDTTRNADRRKRRTCAQQIPGGYRRQLIFLERM